MELIDPGPKPGERYWDDELGMGISSESNQINSDPTLGGGDGKAHHYDYDYDDESDQGDALSDSGNGKGRPKSGGEEALGDTMSSSD